MSSNFRAVVVGVSSGGVQALTTLLGSLPADFPLPLLVVQHIGAEAGDGLARLLDAQGPLRVKEADEQEIPRPGHVYLAAPNYHLLVEPDGRLALSAEAPVSYARPSVDVLFESAAEAWGPALIGVVLTGANHDGSRGLVRIKARGGIAIVQDPADAEAAQMPQAALAALAAAHIGADHVVALTAISALLAALAATKGGRHA